MADEIEDTVQDAVSGASPPTDVQKGAQEIGDVVGGFVTDQFDQTKEAAQWVGDQLGAVGQWTGKIIEGVSPYLPAAAKRLAAVASLMQTWQRGEIRNEAEGWSSLLQLFADEQANLEERKAHGDPAAQRQLEQLESGITTAKKNLAKAQGTGGPMGPLPGPAPEGAGMDALPQDTVVATEQVALAIDRAPRITGGAISDVTNNFGALMLGEGGGKSGDWVGRLTVGSQVGASLLAAHQKADDKGRKAWIYNDAANAVLSEEEMGEYYKNPSADKWKGMHVVMSAEGGYYEVFENPVKGLRAAIENVTSRIVRYGESTPGALVGSWAPEKDDEGNPINPEGSEGTYSKKIASLVGIKAGEEIDPRNWKHVAGVILGMLSHEAASADAPEISAEVLYNALNNSRMATGKAKKNKNGEWIKVTDFGREPGHGFKDNGKPADFSLKDVKTLLDQL